MTKCFCVSFYNFEIHKDLNEASGPILLRLEFISFSLIGCDNRSIPCQCHKSIFHDNEGVFFNRCLDVAAEL